MTLLNLVKAKYLDTYLDDIYLNYTPMPNYDVNILRVNNVKKGLRAGVKSVVTFAVAAFVLYPFVYMGYPSIARDLSLVTATVCGTYAMQERINSVRFKQIDSTMSSK